jgi:hypothetical protein
LASCLRCKIVADSLNFCHKNKGLRINAYVIMPTHFHAIVFGQEPTSDALKATLRDFRKFTGRQLTDYCISHMPRCFGQIFAELAGEDRNHMFLQPTLHPEAIETKSFWTQKRDYLHDNPRRKGLVERMEYGRFSSASWWLSDGQVGNDVILSVVEW